MCIRDRMNSTQQEHFDVQKLKKDFMAKILDNHFTGEEKEALSRLFQIREFTGKDFGKIYKF